MANHNSQAQIVISGESSALEAAAVLVKDKGGKAIALKVSGAWHSALIAGAIPDFTEVMGRLQVNPPQTPVIFNVTAAPADDPARIREIMASQIAATVRWHEVIEYLLAAGARRFIEVGPCQRQPEYAVNWVV